LASIRPGVSCRSRVERRGDDSQAAEKGFCLGLDARAEARFLSGASATGRVPARRLRHLASSGSNRNSSSVSRVLTIFITHIFVVNEQKFCVGPFVAALDILDTEIRCMLEEVVS
jgi:hypothetical protein